MKLSVVICTYNGGDRLIRTLESLSACTEDFDIVVVDNNSSDDTKIKIERYMQINNKVKYLFEKKRGLSHARNRAISTIDSEIIAFTDDDVIVSHNWVANILKTTYDDKYFLIYGKTLLFDKSKIKLSIKESKDEAVYVYPCSPWGIGHGNNMIIRKQICNEIGFFDVGLGAGTSVGSAEDTDFCYRALKKGYGVLYTPECIVYHNHKRVSKIEVETIRKNYRKGAGAFYYKHIMNLDLYVCKMCYWGIIEPVLKGSYNLSHFKNIILGALCYIASKLPLRRI